MSKDVRMKICYQRSWWRPLTCNKTGGDVIYTTIVATVCNVFSYILSLEHYILQVIQYIATKRFSVSINL